MLAALVGLATVPAGAVLASPLASEPDPHVAWWVERETERAIINAPGYPDIADDDPHWLRMTELKDLIGETPARTLEGVLVQLRFFGTELHRSRLATCEDNALTNAIEMVERLVGSASHG